MNRYLRDRADRRRMDRASRDMRRGDRRYDRRSDMRRSDRGWMPRDERQGDRRDYRDYRDYGYDSHYGYIVEPFIPREDYERYQDRRSDYGDYGDYGEDEEEYEKHLKKLCEKLKKRDRFSLPKEEVISRAKKMGVQFNEYNEEELYVVYLMMVTDFTGITNDPHSYIAMAKQWLEDDDVMRRGSDKLCAYIYAIVLGED